MKKLLLLLVLTTAISNAQICGAGGVFPNSQTAVNNFVATYAGTCNTIDGYLYLSGTDIVDILDLSFLTTINESLCIYNTSTNVDNFSGLNFINNYLYNFKFNIRNLPNKIKNR